MNCYFCQKLIQDRSIYASVELAVGDCLSCRTEDIFTNTVEDLQTGETAVAYLTLPGRGKKYQMVFNLEQNYFKLLRINLTNSSNLTILHFSYIPEITISNAKQKLLTFLTFQ